MANSPLPSPGASVVKAPKIPGSSRHIKSQPGQRKAPSETMKLPPRRRRGMVSPTATLFSCDGLSYEFKKLEANSKDPNDFRDALIRMCMVALAEVAKGGDVLSVLTAFKVEIRDIQDQVFFDFRRVEEYTAAIGDVQVGEVMEPLEEGEYEGSDLVSTFAAHE